MIKITKWEGGKLVTSEYKPSAPAFKRGREPQAPDEAIVVGIINYLKLAESDGRRYQDVLDEFMKTQPAATMKQVAARRMSCRPPRTKIEAKKLLVKAYNLSALSPK